MPDEMSLVEFADRYLGKSDTGFQRDHRVLTDVTPVNVAVADKSPLVRAALKQLISEDGRFRLVDVCNDGEAFLSLAAKHDLDVGVVGWVMPSGDGKYILDHLPGIDNPPRIVVYTGLPGDSVASQIMAHGGAAFVSKSDPVEFLLDTIAGVAAGRMIFPYLDVRTIHDNPLTSLTKRELEVLSSLAAGRTNKEIAREQEVSPNTIKFHIKNLYGKLGVRNRSEAIALYLRS